MAPTDARDDGTKADPIEGLTVASDDADGEGANAEAAERPLAFVGFMGVGKSTIGRGVANAMGRAFFDTDDLVVERLGREISELFAAGDEPLFRATEAAIIAELVGVRPPAVLALGGGAFEDDVTRALLLQRAIVVHLDLPFTIVAEELHQLRAGRPLLAEADEAEVRERYLARREHYLKAQVQVPVGRGGAVIEIAAVLSALFALGFTASAAEGRGG